jgi:D-glycero-D-manno-heptose 1,7-bisphosphate phosphatase
MRRAIFLDRDGVLNKVTVIGGLPYPPKDLGEVKVINGVRKAIKLFSEHDFVIVVVTNQPDVARNVTSIESVNQINQYLMKKLGLKHFYTCFHDDKDLCMCRKPKPGLLKFASSDLELDLTQSFVIGDRWRDIEAGQAAKSHCYFIDYDYLEKRPNPPYTKVSSLIEAARLITKECDENFI